MGFVHTPNLRIEFVMEFTLAQVAQMIDGEVRGDASLKVNRFAKIEDGTAGAISFLGNPRYEQFLYTTQATAVIIAEDFQPKENTSCVFIAVKDPYTAFSALLEFYSNNLISNKTGIEEPSFLGDGTQIGERIYRGAFSYVGKKCVIGDDVKIHPNVSIGDNVRIGDGTVLYPGTKVYDNCIIGAFCTIHANAVIGSDGFGFVRQPDGTYKNVPQLGNVILEDYVCVGASTTIDCATLPGSSTVLRKGVKLDNLIQVAHNVEIGENTVVASQTGISGSTKIGANCIIGGQVGVAGHIKIANRTTVASQAGVTKTVKEEGLTLWGTPAIPHREQLKNLASIKRISDLEARIQALEQSAK